MDTNKSIAQTILVLGLALGATSNYPFNERRTKAKVYPLLVCEVCGKVTGSKEQTSTGYAHPRCLKGM